MADVGMRLRVLLPHRVHADCTGVQRIVVATRQGSMGLLPHRLDCVAILVPGILCYETTAAGERYLALDAGVLVKTGSDVAISVRNAIGGVELASLRARVEQEFVALDAQERLVRGELAKLESGFMRRYLEFHRG
jgi:F-type H+-transporting ATPase subunit epsilon